MKCHVINNMYTKLIIILLPFIFFVFMAIKHAIFFVKFKRNIREVASELSAGESRSESLNVAFNYDSIIYGYTYMDHSGEVISFKLSGSAKGLIAFIHKNIPSGWSYYSTVIAIFDDSLRQLNKVISKSDQSSINLHIRRLKARGANFSTYLDERGAVVLPTELNKYHDFMRYCIDVGKGKVIFDAYQGKLVVVFCGGPFSNILSPEKLKLIIGKIS